MLCARGILRREHWTIHHTLQLQGLGLEGIELGRGLRVERRHRSFTAIGRGESVGRPEDYASKNDRERGLIMRYAKANSFSTEEEEYVEGMR